MSSIPYFQNLLLALLLATSYYRVQSYTFEPPGRDPASIDKIRSSEQATILTTENFDDLTAGKLVFIKFYAPYCPHCNNMAKSWNELAEYYQNNGKTDVLIGSIDCTDSPHGKNLCIKFKITGLPTLLYGPSGSDGVYLEEYGGEKTYDDLKSFALKELVPKCLPVSLDACTAEERQEMDSYIAMSYTQLNEMIQSLEKQMIELKESFKTKFMELQKDHDRMLIEKELKITRSKETIKMIKEVRETLVRDRQKTEL
ncbi:hypothetical protein HJC23_004901 [Cyclotella cryptica]|uniref:Thioredoxin domain-containing protein n=1 Tax=Cyclotella cryptica TaxID=29204 RepID=A0ABD3P4E6_9STRA|eukprot:CCRYP_017547-RA/>CCRYP_017547-RA protein AED:0.39 eAED:0.39 QI:0/-1/0/1/-1/1/1/0/255